MTARRKASGKWYFRRSVRMAGGIVRRIFGMPEAFGLPNTRVGAVEAERCAVTALLEGRDPHPVAPSSVITLAAFAPTYLEHSDAKNKARTVDSKRQILRDHILPRLGSTPLDQVTFAAIEDMKHAALETLSAKTANNVLTVLRRLLELARRRGVIEAVPDIEWLRAAQPTFDFLDFAEADRLVAAADGEWRSMVLVALRTGLRQGELLGLQWADVDLVAGRLTVRRSRSRGHATTPKSGKARDIPLSPSVVAALKAQRHLRGDYVWCDEAGRPLPSGSCKHPLYRAARRAGLRRVGWHVLRHTFASHLAMRGVTLITIRDLLGHATMTMTLRYAHLSPEVSREAVTLLDGATPVPRGGTSEQIRSDESRRRR